MKTVEVYWKAQNMPQVFRTIAQAKEGVLFHCSAGKDRSGTVAAILLLLAGVGINDIVIPHEEYMKKFIDMFRKEYQTAENYLLQIGLSDNEVMKIKGKLITAQE